MKNIKLPERCVQYKNDSWTITEFDYQKQYYPYYRSRFNQMKTMLMSTVKSRWPSIPIYLISDLADNNTKNIESDYSSQESEPQSLHQNQMLLDKDIVVMGTLLKKMNKQPNILKELDDERKLFSQQPNGDVSSQVNQNFTDPADILFLQDGDESIELKGLGIKIQELCTGICLACKGQINPNGSGFLVEDVCFIGSHLVSASPVKTKKIERPLCTNDYYILIVSGLSFSNDLVSNQKLIHSLNILFDLVSGNSDFILEKTIVQLIMAGNNINFSKADQETSLSSSTWSQNNKANSHESVQFLDKFLANIGQTMFVDVMPGQNDLSTYLWPQQPLHPCMFPMAHRLTTIQSVTNPHRACYYGVDVLGTSGQNVDSIRQCTKYRDSVDIMRQLLEWGHICPTCPDLLHSYPFSNNNDPMALKSDDYPDVFFAGNQPDFSVGSFIVPDGSRNVRLISVPAFNEKFIGVLLNLKNLECEMVAFN